MTALNILFPDATHRRAQALAAAEGMSLDQFVVTKLDELLHQQELLARFKERARRGGAVDIDALFAKVPDVAADPEDRLGTD